MVTSSTSLTVTFQEPLSVNSAVVTKYKGTDLDIFHLCYQCTKPQRLNAKVFIYKRFITMLITVELFSQLIAIEVEFS